MIEFKLDKNSIRGPVDLRLTIQSGQTAGPEWEYVADHFVDSFDRADGAIKFEITQVGSTQEGSLYVKGFGESCHEPSQEALRQHIINVLRLEDDLESFYQYLQTLPRDPTSNLLAQIKGLRLMRAENLFECLICSLASQNNSVLLWNRSIRLLEKFYGRSVRFEDGTIGRLFPTPESLAKLKPRELNSKTSVGYRAKYFIKAARMVRNGDLDLEHLRKLDFQGARESLLEVLGVGPKVADCFLLYGLGKTEAAPVDVWIDRIARILYFKRKRKVTRKGIGDFLRETYGAYAGYVQLYLFHYARTRRIIRPSKRKSRDPRVYA